MPDRTIIRRLHSATALITFAALVFALFFQVNKRGPLGAINPFAEDPFDAVGSFAVQGALLVSLLTYARVLRLRNDLTQAAKMRLIQRGNLLALSAILVTLLADGIAVTLHPISTPVWGNLLLGELAGMLLLVLICAGAFVAAFWHLPTETPPNDLSPADAIDDVWTLAQVPVAMLNTVLPRAVVGWVRRFNSDWLFARAPWCSPRLHPWRFACLLGILLGVGLVVVQLREGLPPTIQTGLLVAGMFISAELAATLAGFAFFGGYLGLRPSFRR